MKQIILLLLVFTFSLTMGQAQKQVSGTVLDGQGEPLIGVTVSLKNTTTGTITGNNGNYEIDVPEDAILMFSYIGFLTEEIEVGGQTKIDISLIEDFTGLEEVVVIGYGTTRKKDLTGSVSSLGSEAFESRLVASFEEGIKGNVAGVLVTSAGGEPGAEMKVKIRGITSINSSNNPLIVVDGFPLSESNGNVGGSVPSGASSSAFGSINPDDIASVEFLKDASASAIYGSRGANGVILITTKKGRTGKPIISYSNYFGQKSVTKTYDMLNLEEYTNYQHIVTPANRLYTKREDRSPIDYSPVESVDWQDEIFRTGTVQNHSISIQGGTEQTKYLISGAYYNEDAVVIGNNYKKYNFKVSLDQKLTKNVRVGVDLSYGFIKNDGIISEGGFDSSAGLLTYAASSAPLDNTDPNTWQFRVDSVDQRGIEDLKGGRYTFVTPKTYALDAQNDTKNGRLITNTFLEYIITENLKLKVTGGVDVNNIKNYQWYPKSTPHGAFYDTKALLGHVRSSTWLNENTLSYSKYWTGGTNFSLVGGFTQQFYNWEMFRVEVGQFENETLGVNAIQDGLDIPNRPYSRLDEHSMRSFFGRAAYNLQDKYLLTATLRADGSSRFLEGKRWGYFPSAAFAWRVSNESFMSSLQWLNDLKFRASYGSIGNEAVNNSAAFSTLNNTEYISNGSIVTGKSPNNMVNNNLSWETTNSVNTGLDLTVYRNRINLVVDVYKKTTVDVLLQAPLSRMSGFSDVWGNIGIVENKGIELALNTTIINQKDFQWLFSINYSKNKNKVLELVDDNASIPIGASPDGSYQDDYLIEVGQPIGNMFGYVWEGNYQESDFAELDYENNIFVLKDDVPYRFGNERPGDIKFKNFDDDLQVNESDRKVIGNGLPDHYGGFTTNFIFKNIELFAGFNWSYGNEIYNFNKKRLANLTGSQNQLADAWLNRWTPENPNNENYSRYLDQKPSSYWIEDGSYLRFQTLRLSYNIPKELTSKIKITDLKINFTIDNVYTWTDYSGYDPEVSRSNAGLAIGLDYGSYPRARSFIVGISMKL